MNSRLLLNIGLLIAIGALVLLVMFEPGKEPPPEKIRLTSLAQSDVNHVLIKRNKLPDIELEKRNKIWFMLQPYPLPANDFRANTITRIATAESFAQYDLTKADSKKFKLDNPAATITFNKQITVELGDNEPIKRRRYVKNNNKLHIVDDYFYYQVMSTATSYVAYNLLSPDSALDKIELPELQIEFKNDKWHVSPQPDNYSADSLTNLLNEWSNAQSLEVEKYDGKKLKNKIKIHLRNSDQVIAFAIKRDKPDVYLIRNDLKLQYKLTEEMFDKLLTLPPPPEAEEEAVKTEADAPKQ